MDNKDKTIVFRKSSNPLTQPRVDENGMIFADPGPNHYVVVFDKNGPWRARSSNAAWSLHQFAEDMAMFNSLDSLIVREDTHEAVFFYRADTGLEEGWKEENPEEGARERAEKFGR